jgi:hypothetical protein
MFSQMTEKKEGNERKSVVLTKIMFNNKTKIIENSSITIFFMIVLKWPKELISLADLYLVLILFP